MATAAALRPAAAVVAAEHPPEEHTSVVARAVSPVDPEAITNCNGGSNNAARPQNDTMNDSCGQADVNIDATPTRAQHEQLSGPSSPGATAESSHRNEQVGLDMSRSPSPPTDDIIPGIAAAVSEEAISLAVENVAAGSSADVGDVGDVMVDATLLPRQRRNDTPEEQLQLLQTLQSNQSPPTNADGGSEAAMLMDRIAQLEQSLGLVTELCQSLMQQQQQSVGSRGHSREGSQSTGESSSPGSSTPNTPSPTSRSRRHDDDSDARLLSQWPPSYHVLDSPDVSTRQSSKRGRRQRSSRNNSQRRSSSASSGGSPRKSLGTGGKTMSMVLLDIAPGESRGPSMIPFTSDLDACDEMDGDSVAGGCRDGSGGGRSKGSGGGNSRSGSETASFDGSSRSGSVEKQRPSSRSSPRGSEGGGSSSDDSPRRQGRRPRRLSSSMKEGQPNPENHLECQAYTTSHLEALRLRREAGKGRAYSFNDSLSQGGDTPREQWQPSLDAVGGSPKEPGSAVSSASFVDALPTDAEQVDIAMPDLSAPSTDSDAANKDATTDTKSIGTIPSFDKIAHSASVASNLSSDTTKTVKSGNTNDASSTRKSKLRSGSESSRSRSQSIASNDPATATKTPSKRDAKGKSPTNKSPQKTSSEDAAAKDNGKSNQTIKEYVINDLLNLDSRNQDGSATEDIDANMEEFLRIPSKLENLMVFSLAVCMDSFLYAWAMLPLKFAWGVICLVCTIVRPRHGFLKDVRFHRRHLYPLMQSVLIWFVYSQVLCPISIGKLYHWVRGQAMLKLYVVIAIVEVFDRLLCSFGQDAWDSLYWNTTRRPRHPRMFVSIIVVGVYVTIHSLFLFVHVATLSVAVNSADNALMTLLIGGNFAEIKSTVFKKYNKQNLFKITTSDICERFKLALFLLLILFLNRFQGDMTSSMVKDYYSMCGVIFAAELISDWIKHSFITKFNLIKSSTYFDYALVLSGDVTGIGHEGLNLDYTHAVVKRLGLAQIPLVCVTARYLHEAIRFAIAFQGNGDVDHPVSALVDLMAGGNKWIFCTGLLRGLAGLVLFKILLGMCLRFVARRYLGVATERVSKGSASTRKSSSSGTKTPKKETSDVKKKQ
ncbi:hypothetical protein ACHAXT_008006 [Thalassiosira profunda]